MTNKSIMASTATILLALTITTILLPSLAYADMTDWLNKNMDWISNGTGSFYETQKRGYAIGGGIRAKFNFDDDPIVDFDGPSLKAGCGGIHGKLGALSYLNFEELVQKLQQILSAAPAFAFSLALKTLCEACENIIQTLEAITNMINQFNINSCNASKALVGYAGELFYRAVGDKISIGPINTSWYKGLTNGLQNVSNDINNFVYNYAGYYDCAMQQGSNLKTCLGKMGKISFIEPFWDTVFAGTQSKYISLLPTFRGWFGDFKQKKSDAADNSGDKSIGLTVIPKDRCPDQKSASLMEAMITGNYSYRSTFDGDCFPGNSVNGSLGAMLQSRIDSVKNAIQGGYNITDAADLNLINSTSIPIWSMLSMAATLDRIENGPGSTLLTDAIIQKIMELLPYEVAINSLRDALGVVQTYVAQATAQKADSTAALQIFSAITAKQQVLKTEFDAGNYLYKEQLDKWKGTFDSSMEEYNKMKTQVYRYLGKSKLLDSYLFAKGMR